MLKKTKKPIRFSFFWSKKRRIRQRFHIFHQKTPNIQNFITKTLKKASHPQKNASWCQNLSENSKSKPFYILTIWWWHKTLLSRVFLPRNSPTQPKSKKAIAYTINFSIQYYCILFYILNYSCMNKQNQHVVPHSNGWAVKTPNSERASRVFWTQKEATFYARERAQQNGSELFIHNREGKIRERNSYWKDPYPPKW